MDGLPPVYVANVRMGCPFYFSGAKTSTETTFLRALEEGKVVYVIAEEDIEVPQYLTSHAKRVFRYKRGASWHTYLKTIMDEENTRNLMVI